MYPASLFFYRFFYGVAREGGRIAFLTLLLCALCPLALRAEDSEATPTPGESPIPEGAAEARPDAAADKVTPRGPGWSTEVRSSPHLPERIIVVDKSVQRLYIYAHQSPLKLSHAVTCTTGQRPGDKLVSGDRRTPEGIYFVTSIIDKGLDFQEYGGVAHTLNYPNPVDRLRGKTGYGIWIHSRGRPITPLETKGCIAIDLHDIARLGPEMQRGTPVVLAESVRGPGMEALSARPSGIPEAEKLEAEGENARAARIEEQTRDWNAAWAGRSRRMFDFYQPEAYSRANESFEAFRAQKERLFGQLDWIQIVHGPIHVMQGPDYWVSWFEQYYRASNLSTEGIRRLYWQPDDKGTMRIVGMEWLPMDLGMEGEYLESVTPSVVDFIERWRKAWLAADVEAYSRCYTPEATQAGRVGLPAITRHKQDTWAKKKPARVAFSGIRVMMAQGGIKVDFMQSYKDASGYQDRGLKTVLLHPDGADWRIAAENWSAVPK